MDSTPINAPLTSLSIYALTFLYWLSAPLQKTFRGPWHVTRPLWEPCDCEGTRMETDSLYRVLNTDGIDLYQCFNNTNKTELDMHIPGVDRANHKDMVNAIIWSLLVCRHISILSTPLNFLHSYLHWNQLLSLIPLESAWRAQED